MCGNELCSQPLLLFVRNVLTMARPLCIHLPYFHFPASLSLPLPLPGVYTRERPLISSVLLTVCGLLLTAPGRDSSPSYLSECAL